jgi:predicted nucleic acid-binding protein
LGQLSLPASGVIYVDTSPIIYSVEKYADYWTLLRPLWEASKAGQLLIVSSELALLETLVGPLKSGDHALAKDYERLLTRSEMRLLPVTISILKDAAQLRAQTNLKTPDAIHAATALASGCVQFLTNDVAFRRVPKLPVVVLQEVAAA